MTDPAFSVLGLAQPASGQTLRQMVSSYLGAAGLSASYQLQALPAAPAALRDLARLEAALYELSWQGVVICESYIKAQRLGDGSPLLSAELPLSSPLPPPTSSAPWPTQAKTWQQVAAVFSKGEADPALALVAARPCYLWQAEQWHMVWELSLTADSLPYLAFGDEQRLYKRQQRFATLTGVLGAYRSNPKDGTVIEQSVDLVGDGTLRSERFVTAPRGVARAQHPDHRFVVSTSDPSFAEITSFAALNRMYDWLHGYGYKWTGAPLVLKIHELVKVGSDDSGADIMSVNNAFSQPASGGQAAYILLGDGDGQVLQNLALDADIVSHELNHQLIFTALSSTELLEDRSKPADTHEHSGAIHEGLADYLTYASSGDACLGESVCPVSSEFCYEVASCLRKAELSLSYGSEEYWRYEGLPHVKGQVVAAMLWDVRQAAGANAASIDQLVVQAVGFLSPRSSYEDLLIALLTADYEFHAGRFACSIASFAKQRGFTREMAAITDDCSHFVPPRDSKAETVGGDDTPESEVKTPARGSRFRRLNCATMVVAPGGGPPWRGGASGLLLSLLGVLPLLVAGFQLYGIRQK